MFHNKKILPLIGLIPVFYLAILFTPVFSAPPEQILAVFEKVLHHPFSLHITNATARSFLVFSLLYGLILLLYDSQQQNYRRGTEHGSAVWGNWQEVMGHCGTKNTLDGRILTQHIALDTDTHRHGRNLNVLVCGGSGSGKTRYFAKPNVMNACNCSMVILDPKSEICSSTAHLLQAKGYEIRVLNLISMEDSWHYNPFVYLSDDNSVQKLVTNLFENTVPEGKSSQDPFWDQTAMMLLMALVFYLHDYAPPSEQNFSMVMEMIRAGEVQEDNDSFRSPLDLLFDELELRDRNSIALKYYRSYRSGSGKTLKSIQISLLSRLEKFNLSTLSELTSCDELDLGSLGEKKVALFAVIPDNDTSFNFIIGMLYTQLFQQLYYSADFIHGGALPVPVHFVMDEFANVAIPSSFDKLLATMRSRRISVSIIVQNLAQLKKLFEKEWESVIGNCDSFLYLGGNEQSTHEYISKLLGDETVVYTTHNESKGSRGSHSINQSITGRKLLDASEVRLLDRRKAILFIRGERPILDDKYDIIHHPHIALTADGGHPPYELHQIPYPGATIQLLYSQADDASEFALPDYSQRSFEIYNAAETPYIFK